MTPETHERIGKLIPRLASDQDGEVLATVRALVRTLKAGGLDLHDLVKMLAPPGQARSQRATEPPWSPRASEPDFAAEMARRAKAEAEQKLREAEARRQKTYTPNDRAGGWGGDSSQRVKRDEHMCLYVKDHPNLTAWEKQFTSSVWMQIMAGQNITPRQRSVLNDLYTKYVK